MSLLSKQERLKRGICLADAYTNGNWWPCSLDVKKDGYCYVHHPTAVAKREREKARRQKQVMTKYYRVTEMRQIEQDVFYAVFNAHTQGKLKDQELKSLIERYKKKGGV